LIFIFSWAGDKLFERTEGTVGFNMKAEMGFLVSR
jgi:hypothetical protein